MTSKLTFRLKHCDRNRKHAAGGWNPLSEQQNTDDVLECEMLMSSYLNELPNESGPNLRPPPPLASGCRLRENSF